MSMININDLFADQKQKEKHKEEIYDNVLKNCHNKIRRSVKLSPYNNFCFYINYDPVGTGKPFLPNSKYHLSAVVKPAFTLF